MTNYPLLFTFGDKVEGNGFLAHVLCHGRVLAVKEPEGWWMYGVRPGGLAAPGANLEEAHAEFRRSFTAVLFDIASDAETFEEFKVEAERFFAEINAPMEEEWFAAVQEVRANKINPQEIYEKLEKRPAESPRSIEVKLLESFKPVHNVLDPLLAVAA